MRYSGMRTRNIAFKTGNDMLLVVNNKLHHIPDRNQTHQPVLLISHRQVTDPLICHQSHTILNGIIFRNRNRPFCHDFTDQCFLGSTSFKDHAAGIVTFGKNSHEMFIFINYCQRSHIMVNQELKGFKNSIVGIYGEYCMTLYLQDITYLSHGKTFRIVNK